MAQPITWQNVNQGDASTAWRAMDSAQRSINGAFDGLQGQITKSEDIQAKNDIAIKNNNSQDYLNKLYSQFKSPEDLAAGLTDGRVDKLKAAYGNAINHDQVRGAAEALLKGRQEQVTAGHAFSNSNMDFQQQGAVDSIMSKLNSGDPLQIAAGKAEFAAHPELRNKASIAQAANGAGYQLVERQYAANTDSRAGTMQTATIKNMEGTLANQRDQTAVSRGQLGVSQQLAELQGKQFKMALQDHLDQREAKAVEALGKSRQADAGTLEGQTVVFASIDSAFKGDESGATNARKAFTDIVKKFPGITTQDAMLAVMGQDNSRYLKIDSWVRGNTVDRAGEFSKSPESILRAQAASLQRDATIDVYSRAHQAALAGPMSTGPAPTRNAAKLVEAAKAAQVAPNPVAAPSPAAAQEAVLRTQAAIPAPGADSVILPSSIEGGSVKVGEYPAFSRALKANVNAEALKAKQAELDDQEAKAAKLKAELKAYRKHRPYGSND